MKTTLYVMAGFIGLGLIGWLASLGYAWWEQRRWNRLGIGEKLEELLNRKGRP